MKLYIHSKPANIHTLMQARFICLLCDFIILKRNLEESCDRKLYYVVMGFYFVH